MKKNSQCILLGCSLIGLLTNTAYARDELDTVTVTATKTERSEFETPDTISSVNKQDMETAQAQKLSEALKDIPGVNFTSGPRSLAEKPTIRGLGGNRILITVDGTRQNWNSGHKGRVFIDPELLKSVDVMRGAGSALYGSSAMAGVIAMTTKDAEDFLEEGQNFGVRLKGGYQNVNSEWLGTGVLFGVGNLSGTEFDYVVSGTVRNSGDLRVATDDKETDYLDDSALSTQASLTKVTFKPNENHKLAFSYQYSYDRGEIPAQADAITSPTAVLSDRETIVTIPRVSYHYHNPNNPLVNLNIMTYENKQKIKEIRIGTDDRLDEIEFTTPGMDVYNTSVFNTGENLSHVLTYGVEYYKDEMKSKKGNTNNTFFPDSEAEFTGIYIQDEITLYRDWVLIPGVRYDYYKTQTNDSDVAEEAGRSSTSEDVVSPKLGVVYKMTPWANLTFNYAQAFNSPNLQQLYISGNHFGANDFVPNPDLKPERLTGGYELGVKMKNQSIFTGGDSGDLKWNAYYNEYDDFIASYVTTSETGLENVDQVLIYGSELEANYYHPGIDGDAFLGLTYIVGDNLTDNEPLSGIPAHKIVTKVQKYLFNQELMIGLRGEFNLDRTRVPSFEEEKPSYNLYDFYLTWTPPLFAGLDDAQLVFGVDNMFDTAYVPYSSNLPAEGRNVKMTLTAQF